MNISYHDEIGMADNKWCNKGTYHWDPFICTSWPVFLQKLLISLEPMNHSLNLLQGVPPKNKANKMSFYSIPLATSCEHQFCHWLCRSQSVAEIQHSVMETYDLVLELKPHRLMTSLSVRYGGILPSNFQIHPIFIYLCNW